VERCDKFASDVHLGKEEGMEPAESLQREIYCALGQHAYWHVLRYQFFSQT
jgi:hypothetical protein